MDQLTYFHHNKKSLLFITLLLFFSLNIQGQSTSIPKVMTNAEANEFMHRLVEQKAQFVGKPVKCLYDYLESEGYPIKYMSTMSVGPWSQPDRIERMTGVTLYNRSESELSPKVNKDVIIVDISLDIWWDDYNFWHSLPDEGWINVIKQRTADCTVTDISFEWTTVWT